MAYFRRKTIAGKTYVYEAKKVKRPDGKWVEEFVRYVGPEDPVYGGRGPVNIAKLRSQSSSQNGSEANLAPKFRRRPPGED